MSKSPDNVTAGSYPFHVEANADEPLHLPVRYSELAWEMAESNDLVTLAEEVLRGFNPELVVYGLVGTIRSLLACMVELDFPIGAVDLKRFQLEAHREICDGQSPLI